MGSGCSAVKKLIFIILLLPVVVPLIILGMASEVLNEACYKLLHHLTNFRDSL